MCTWVEQKSKQTAIDDRPEPMSSPINNPAYIISFDLVTLCNLVTVNVYSVPPGDPAISPRNRKGRNKGHKWEKEAPRQNQG